MRKIKIKKDKIEESNLEQQEDKRYLEDYKERNYIKRLRIISATLVTSVVLVFSLAMYKNFRVINNYTTYASIFRGNDNGYRYENFSGGVLEYSGNGLNLLNDDGSLRWNHQWTIKAPLINVYDDNGVAIDINGIDVYMFDKDRMIKNFKTKRKILAGKMLSTKDAAILTKGDDSYFINIYNSYGESLIEIKSGIEGMGVPIDMDVSKDEKYLMVSFLHVDKNLVYSTVNIYDVSSEKSDDKLFKTFQYDSTIVSKFKVKEDNIFALSDKYIIKYDIKDNWSEKNLKLGEIASKVFIGENKIIQIDDGPSQKALKVFDMDFNQILYKKVNDAYSEARVFDDEIILISENKLVGYKLNGRKDYELSFDQKIKDAVKNNDGTYIISLIDKTLKIKLNSI